MVGVERRDVHNVGQAESRTDNGRSEGLEFRTFKGFISLRNFKPDVKDIMNFVSVNIRNTRNLKIVVIIHIVNSKRVNNRNVRNFKIVVNFNNWIDSRSNLLFKIVIIAVRVPEGPGSRGPRFRLGRGSRRKSWFHCFWKVDNWRRM